MGNCLETQIKSADLTSAEKPNGASVECKVDSTHANVQPLSTPVQTMDEEGGKLHAFTYGDMRAATRNFRPDSRLGEGGFGCVFKGYIDEETFLPSRPGQGMVVAIKKLNHEGMQGHNEWLAEVRFLGALHHPSLVKLIGFCAEDDHRLLVYEFMPRGSLENHLFRGGNYNQMLTWDTRLKIAIGAARGLAFLHDDRRPVIYRDFKTSNILLDSHYNAKLSDFGLAKNGPTGDRTHVSTRVMGTYGYAAPEYIATGHLTAKSDVYSFGVVMLEILTGRPVLDKNRPGGEQNLVDWARPFLNDKQHLLRIVDPKLEENYPTKAVQKFAIIASRCITSDAKNRPVMKEVVEWLEPLNAKRTPRRAS